MAGVNQPNTFEQFRSLDIRCCYVSVYFLLFFVGFQLVTQFNKNNFEIVCKFKIRSYICIVKQLKQNKMKTIIGYTDSINECDCCGKTELKGTYCIDLDGVELYYGSVCAFKSHGLTTDEQKELKATFTKEQKNKKLYDLHIAPIKEQLSARLENAFTTNYENLTDLAKKIYHQIEGDYNRVIENKAKKYKIAL